MDLYSHIAKIGLNNWRRICYYASTSICDGKQWHFSYWYHRLWPTKIYI